MSDKSAIEWTDATWNVVTGCTKITPGCAYCYIDRSPPFRIAGRKFVKGHIPLVFHPERLDLPLRWSKPRRVFVNSLSDLFHEDVPDDFIRRVFDVMNEADRHTFQVLTKRPERMRALYYAGGYALTANIWMGVTIENARATYRADLLRDIPAAVRFVSAEPLLGSLYPKKQGIHFETLPLKMMDDGYREMQPRGNLDLFGIDWIICGGESGGKHVRPMHPAWAREIRDACLARCKDCAALGTNHLPPEHDGPGFEDGHTHWAPCERPAFFFKQWGSYGPAPDLRLDLPTKIVDGGYHGLAHMRFAGISGKSGGKLLDAREWCEMPRSLVPVG